MEGVFPNVEVGVALIRLRGKVLLVYNQRWGAFSLPMSKRREREDPNVPNGRSVEEFRSAAARAAAEVLGATIPSFPAEPVCDLAGYDQSDHDGKYKRYRFQVFEIKLPDNTDLTRPGALVPGVIGDLLTEDEIADEARMPISKTARILVALARRPARRET